jgi:hypothetical protein
MNVKAYIYNGEKWEELRLYNTAETDERLDEQLDSAVMQVISENSSPFDDFSMIKVLQTDASLREEKSYFYGFDTVERRMGNYYIHSFELVEPTRRLMGALIDGASAIQTITGPKRTLRYALSRLLEIERLVTFSERAEFRVIARGYSKYDEHIDTILGTTPCPEFYWKAQTSLWECLCDIGNVINCIPRLTANAEETAFNTIYFERVNDITAEYEI